MRLDPDIKHLAAAQHACVATWQLRALGASSAEITRIRRSGTWDDAGGRVLRLAGSHPTERQAAMAAVLAGGPGTALSHASAAALWGIGASFRLLPAHVFRAHAIADRDALRGGDRLHKLRGIDDRWVTVLHSLPVVRPELCVYQLCGSVHPERAERALDRAWSLGLVSGQSLRACVRALAKQGRNGTVVLRQLLDARGPAYVPPASALEARFQAIARDHGFTRLRRQVDLGDGDAWVGRVDYLDDDDALVAEVQSEAHHAALSYRRDDGARIAALEAAGYTVVEIWDVDVWHDPAKVGRLLHEGRARARRRRSTAA